MRHMVLHGVREGTRRIDVDGACRHRLATELWTDAGTAHDRIGLLVRGTTAPTRAHTESDTAAAEKYAPRVGCVKIAALPLARLLCLGCV